jgi:hypothetical protein
VGTVTRFWNLIVDALGPMIIFLNSMVVPTIPCEYLFCHPPTDRLRSPA